MRKASTDGTAAALNGRRPAAWAILGALDANQRIEVHLQIQLQPAQSAAGSGTENDYYVNTISSGETEIHVDNPTVNRTLEGLAWLDSSTDGLQDAREIHISGVKAELFRLKDGGDPEKEADYVPLCYSGTDTPMAVQTGKKVSYLAGGGAADYETGRYLFTELPAGTYAVKFTHGEENPDISEMIASPANRGGIGEDHRDSDGIPAYNADRSVLQKTVILGIELPKAEEMSVMKFESKYHDSGFYRRGYELPDTGGRGTAMFYVLGLILAAGAGILLVSGKRMRRKA